MNRKENGVRPLNEAESKYIEKIFTENENIIKSIIYSVLGPDNRDLAQDALGELCLIACKKIEALKVHTCPKAWFIVTARFVTLALIKKQSRYKKRHLFEGYEPDGKWMESFNEVLYTIWLEDGVPQKLVSRLSKRESQIYRMIYVENKRVKEIAVELGVTENLVRNIHKKLRDKIIKAINSNDF